MEPVKQELKPHEIGDAEKEFGIAIRDEKIRDAPLEQLKEVLRLVMVKIGLRAANWPKDEEKAVLLHHIVSNYGGHTAKEILLAFDMGIANKLEVEMVSYENFSCLYFSTVMNAYREWAKKTYRQTVKELPPMEESENLTDHTYTEWIQSLKIDFKAGKIKLDFLPVMVTDWLILKGEIVDWEKYHLHAAQIIRQTLAGNFEKSVVKDYIEFKQMYDEGAFSGKWKNQILRLSKQIALSVYLKKDEQAM